MDSASHFLIEAEERLETARLGLEQARLGPTHIKGGFRNVAVFGRMVTFCTNNLRGKIDGFEDWDREAKKRYFDNDVGRAMVEVRNQIEKQAKNPIFSATHIKSFSTDDLARFPKPKNAVAFFIGDRMGGSGWTIRMENGDELPYYIDLPSKIGESSPVICHEGKMLNLIETSENYVDALQSYLSDLREFLAQSEGK